MTTNIHKVIQTLKKGRHKENAKGEIPARPGHKKTLCLKIGEKSHHRALAWPPVLPGESANEAAARREGRKG